jgi:hypothetical protein
MAKKATVGFKVTFLKAREESWYRCKESHFMWLNKILTYPGQNCCGTGMSESRAGSRLTGSRQLANWVNYIKWVSAKLKPQDRIGMMGLVGAAIPQCKALFLLYDPIEGGVASFLGLMCLANSWAWFFFYMVLMCPHVCVLDLVW